MLKVAVVGATGYTGEELIKVLLRHPQAKIVSLTAKIDEPKNIAEIFPSLLGRIDLVCTELMLERVIGMCDLVFLALPHRVSMEVAPHFLSAGKKVIDLSADYRLKDPSTYEKWYGVKHKDVAHLLKAVYGLPELYRSQIKNSPLIANPGCYPTGIILGAAPLVKKKMVRLDEITVFSLSGVTGTGRRASWELHFSEIDENIKAYKVNKHQHMPEIDQELSGLAKEKVSISFIPHLVPMNRGILNSICLRMKEMVSPDDLLSLYRVFYKEHPFVRILDRECLPQTKDVVGTNYCDIGIATNKEKMTIVVSAIDNLGKGASGQAVQNMNIMHGFEETTGLL